MWLRVFLLSVVMVATASETTGQTFTVSAEIVPGCTVRGTTQTSGIGFGTLSFGVHPATQQGPVQASATTGSGAVELECTAGLTLTVSVDAGLQPGAGSRRLAAAGGAVIPYSLYTDTAFVTAIPLSGGVDIVVPPSGVIEVPIHGVAHLPGVGQPAGSYADTVQVTFSW
jgi:spore coat protein U-like protein